MEEKRCINCDHVITDWYNYKLWKCVAPANGINPVTGGIKAESCHMKNENGNCGDWTPKQERPKRPGLFTQIWRAICSCYS